LIRSHSSSVSSGLAMIMSSITSCYRCLPDVMSAKLPLNY
jgi:hypothetical protein